MEVGRLDLMNVGLAIDCNVLIKDFDKPFISWTYCIISLKRSLRIEKIRFPIEVEERKVW